MRGRAGTEEETEEKARRYSGAGGAIGAVPQMSTVLKRAVWIQVGGLFFVKSLNREIPKKNKNKKSSHREKKQEMAVVQICLNQYRY